VEDNSGIPMLDKLNRKYTFDTSVKISRLDCLKGLFMVNTVRRKIASTVEFNGMEESSPENQQRSPFILTVHVLSNEKLDATHVSPKVAQCPLDTLNQQGNMVSKDYLLNVLKFSEADFIPLTEQETLGGTSASGHRVEAEAAIHLTWYHGKNARTFHDMRFLVVSGSSFDLVIGERSIIKHNLLSPPNFAINRDGKHFLKEGSGDVVKNLTGRAAELENQLDLLYEDLAIAEKAGKQRTVKTLEAKINLLKQQDTKANQEASNYRTKTSTDKETAPDSRKTSSSPERGQSKKEAKDAPNLNDHASREPSNVAESQATGSNSRGGLKNFFRVGKSTQDVRK